MIPLSDIFTECEMKMKMKKKILRTGITILLVSAAVSAGYFAGMRTEQAGNERRAQEPARSDKKDRGTKIAIVNMDEGVETGNGQVQYAAQLLPYTGVEYTVTGLADARIGVETGMYGASVVIPPDFSRSVYSINNQPAESHLTYTISNQISEEKREQAIRNVEALGRNLNDSLTQIYLSSVMKEFHRAQDAADEIIGNDTEDTKLLEAIDPGSLIAMVEIPEMTQVENNVAELDLSGEYARGETLVTDLGAAYQGFLAKGQQDIEQMKEKSGGVNNHMGEAAGALAGANEALENLSLDQELRSFQEKGEGVKGEMEAVFDQYDVYIDEYNQQTEEFIANRKELQNALTEYEKTETAYQKLLENYVAGPDRDHYAFIDRGAYVKRLAEALDTAGVDITPTLASGWEEFLNSVTDQLAEGDYCQISPLIPDHTPVQNRPGDVSLPDAEEVKKPSEVAGDDGVDMETELLNKAGDIIALAETELVDAFHSKTEDLLRTYTEAEEQYKAVGEEARDFQTIFGSYDAASYVDSRQVEAVSGDMQTNHREVEGKVSEYIDAYGRYVGDVYESAGNHVTAVQESVAKAEETSEKLLAEGLAEAKASRGENSKVNLTLLGDLSGKLPYTRIGDVENKEAYGFMAAPLLLEEKEVEADKQETRTKDAQVMSGIDQRLVLRVLLILAGGILFAVLVRMVIVQGIKRRAIEF